MKLKIFLPGIILIALIGTVYGYESFVQLDITAISHACCGTELAQIGGGDLNAKICEDSGCSDCQDEVYQGGAIAFQSYLSGKVNLQVGQQYFFCLSLSSIICPSIVTWWGGVRAYFTGGRYMRLGNCNIFYPGPSEVPAYGFKLIGCPYQIDTGYDCWTGPNVLQFAFPFIA